MREKAKANLRPKPVNHQDISHEDKTLSYMGHAFDLQNGSGCGDTVNQVCKATGTEPALQGVTQNKYRFPLYPSGDMKMNAKPAQAENHTFQEATSIFYDALDNYVRATNDLTQATKDFVDNARVMTDACDEMEHTLKMI